MTEGNIVSAAGDVRFDVVSRGNPPDSDAPPSIRPHQRAGHLILPGVDALLPQMSRLQATRAQFRLAPLTVSLFNFDIQYSANGGELRIQGATAICDTHHCMLAQSALFPCPHDAGFISLHAEKIDLRAQRIRLMAPRLRLNNHTVFGVPSLKLVPDTQPGFLPPIIGFSPAYGMKLGPRVHLPLTGTQYASVESAFRTNGGIENGLSLNGNRSWLSVRHLYDETHHRATIQG
ncbi:MAG: hypothetical protein JXX14_12890, partial [Deltaproteobacteria bacterium]|nr:hypothetical protein [Deltaproteobacteria bacterium]